MKDTVITGTTAPPPPHPLQIAKTKNKQQQQNNNNNNKTQREPKHKPTQLDCIHGSHFDVLKKTATVM